MNESGVVMLFSDAALGCRFRYLNEAGGKIWIKISDDNCGLVAEYDAASMQYPKWSGQQLCSFADSEEEMRSMKIEVLPEQNGADAREIESLKAEIERLKLDNEVLKGYVERNK